MRRVWIATAAAAVACFDGTGSGPQPRLTLAPLLDTVFVGDTTPGFLVTYVTPGGDTQPPGPVTWRSDRPAVATVDAGGRVAGVGRGETIISATAGGATGRALFIVTNTLQATLLLDTIYLMTGDTITVPVEVLKKGGGAPAPSFDASPVPAVLTIDSDGFVRAVSNGGPIPFVVRADTAADTGWVHVVASQDTTVARSRSYFTIFGTVIRRLNASVRALDYQLRDGSRAFRVAVLVEREGQTVENVVVTLPDSFAGPGTFVVDSISPAEATGAGGLDFICQPERSWGIWGSVAFNPPLNALSRTGGELTVTQLDTVPGGFVVSGRFLFDAQRMDFYDDPGGLLPIRGTFVAPLVTNLSTCQ
jgi:hypothetical protein